MNSIFDIIGPVMIGPSSSHTAGAARLGKMARCIFRSTPKRVALTLYGSFAKTYKGGHGTDKALLGGLLGFKEDDTNIRIADTMAQQEGMEYKFIESPLDVGGHPNVVRFDMYDEHNRHMAVVGRSLGGGQIMITEVDGNDMSITGGDEFTLVVFHEDRPVLFLLSARRLANRISILRRCAYSARAGIRMRLWLLLRTPWSIPLRFSLCASAPVFRML